MEPSRYQRGATLHGQRRVRKRMKLPARAVARLVRSARTDGLSFDDMPGWLRIAVQHKRQLHPEGSDYVFYRGYLFVFREGLGDLITTYPLHEEDPEYEPVDWEQVRKSRKFF
jgi:hypothetical protein